MALHNLKAARDMAGHTLDDDLRTIPKILANSRALKMVSDRLQLSWDEYRKAHTNYFTKLSQSSPDKEETEELTKDFDDKYFSYLETLGQAKEALKNMEVATEGAEREAMRKRKTEFLKSESNLQKNKTLKDTATANAVSIGNVR